MTFQAIMSISSSRSPSIISVSLIHCQQAITHQAQPSRLKLMARLLNKISTQQSLAVLAVALVA